MYLLFNWQILKVYSTELIYELKPPIDDGIETKDCTCESGLVSRSIEILLRLMVCERSEHTERTQ